MVSSFLRALRALTILPVPAAALSRPRKDAVYLVSFPVIGLFFGFVGKFIIDLAYPSCPVFIAWVVPVLWLIISGANHFADLTQTLGVFFFSDSHLDGPGRSLKGEALVQGASLALILWTGKILAFLQLAPSLFAGYEVGLIVLLIPVFSRYVACLLALGSKDIAPDLSVSDRWFVSMSTTLVAIAIGFVCLPLALYLLIWALISTLLLRAVSMHRLGFVPSSLLGAEIEVSEIAMLWAVAVAGALGLHLTQIIL